MGMVLPTVDLIPTLTTWENVAITLLLDGRRIDEGRTIVMATHDTRAAAYANRSIRLLDGRLVVATPPAERTNGRRQVPVRRGALRLRLDP